MKLILQKDVKNVGKAGDQVSVKNGFARNFLIPKGYAVLLNKDRLRTWNHQKVMIEAKKRKALSERQKIIDKLSSIKLIFEKESQKDNKIFGSVTAYEISQALEEKHNLSVDKKDIYFSELKTVGDHKIDIRLDSDLKTEILLTIKGKIRKKKEEVFVKKTSEDQELKPSKEETAVLSDTPKSKDQTNVVQADSQEQTSTVQAESSVTDTDKEDQKNENQKQMSSFEKKAFVKKSQTKTAKPSHSKDFADKKATTDKENKKEEKSRRQEKSLQSDKEKQLRREEKLIAKADKKEKSAQIKKSMASSSKDKEEPKKESKKSGGLFKKFFGK